MTNKKLVIVPDDYPPLLIDAPSLQELANYSGTELQVYNSYSKSDELLPRIKHAHTVIVMHPSTAIGEDMMRQCENLKHIAIWGVSNGNFDLVTAHDLGIVVTHTPEKYVESVAEHTLALMLALARRIPELNDRVRLGEWPSGVLTQLFGKTLGLVGTGAVALRVAKIARGIGMNIIGVDIYKSGSADKSGKDLTFVDFEKILLDSDIISVHAEYGDWNFPKFSREAFSMMKPTALFVNTSSGVVVDDYALIEALRNETIAGAALDVFGKEPLESTSPLIDLPNVILSPHIGMNTQEAISSGIRELIDNVLAYFEGRVVGRVPIPKIS